MTEADKLRRAKMYVDKLALGIDPLSDTYVAETDVVRQERIVRCLMYVSEVLEREIVREEKPERPKKMRRADKDMFYLPPAKREAFAYSDTPIPISEITKRLNTMIDPDTMRILTASTVNTWLADAGLLRYVQMGASLVLRPTPEGSELGLLVEEREGNQGNYQIVVYTREAQQMIIDNLDAILTHADDHLEMQGRAWTEEQDRELTMLYQNHASIPEIARHMKRQTGAIRSRLRKLGCLV